MRIWLAIRAFFKVLFDAQCAADMRRILDGETPAPHPSPEDGGRGFAIGSSKPAPPARSDAITLLATLQREARFVDIVKEPLGEYSDAQIGAAARDVLRDCAAVLDRIFAIEPAVEKTEGDELEAPAGFDTGCYRLTGNFSGEPPFVGQLAHHGWRAARCELPQWSGSRESALVVAPIELDVS